MLPTYKDSYTLCICKPNIIYNASITTIQAFVLCFWSRDLVITSSHYWDNIYPGLLLICDKIPQTNINEHPWLSMFKCIHWCRKRGIDEQMYTIVDIPGHPGKRRGVGVALSLALSGIFGEFSKFKSSSVGLEKRSDFFWVKQHYFHPNFHGGMFIPFL